MRIAVPFAVTLASMACAKAPADTAPPLAARAHLPASCMAGETTIFACTFENGERVSVCSRGSATASFRSADTSIEGGKWARIGYSGGGELQIAFDKGKRRYVVYSRTIRTSFSPEDNNPPGGGDGLVVLRNGKFESLLKCRASGDNAYYGEASEADMQLLPQSDDLFTDETARGDTDLPG